MAVGIREREKAPETSKTHHQYTELEDTHSVLGVQERDIPNPSRRACMGGSETKVASFTLKVSERVYMEV